MLQPGDRVSTFRATADDGGEVTDQVLRAGAPAVLFFYPKDNTIGCTMEACSFRDHYAEFREAGASVWGISADSVESHVGFRQKHALPYRLLSDPDRAVARAFGLKAMFGLIPPRVTFVIDADGVIQEAFDARINALAHIDRALATVKRLSAQKR